MSDHIITIQENPNITIRDNNLSLKCGADIPPSNIGYAYPKLTQTTSYRDGDEGWQLANVWNSIYAAANISKAIQVELSDFYTLKQKNQFGNYSRFTLSDGTPAKRNGSDYRSYR